MSKATTSAVTVRSQVIAAWALLAARIVTQPVSARAEQAAETSPADVRRPFVFQKCSQ
ncbi:MAG: hypothetical protein MZW92_79890 [Comamonadaceae bacterium]|nr:hypothetical protein [Comamonadaceae bacterium]